MRKDILYLKQLKKLIEISLLYRESYAVMKQIMNIVLVKLKIFIKSVEKNVNLKKNCLIQAFLSMLKLNFQKNNGLLSKQPVGLNQKNLILVSATLQYRGIYNGLFDTKAEKKSNGNKGAIRKLRHRGKSRHTKAYLEKRGKIQISNKISDRPEAAENRERLGDWEIDTVCGKPGKSCLVTIVDRKSRFTIIRKIARKNSNFVTATLIGALKDLPLETITPDRGKEFSKHSNVTKALGVEFYFPLPHHPWQRGTNENTNGLIREYFPKGIDITNVPYEVVQLVEDKLNTRPRKCLGFKTPFEIFYNKLLHLA